MITVQSDIKLSFEELRIKFMSILDEHRNEIEQITRDAVDKFDFKKALDAHIERKIKEGIDRVFEEIDLSDPMRRLVWSEIERRMGGIR